MPELSPSKTFVVGISSHSGGGKTTVAKRVSEILKDTVLILFDDYDFDTVHPESFQQWHEKGADYNAWKTPRLKNDLSKLKAGEPIKSAIDGTTFQPQPYLIFDAPLGYAHAETGALIDFMVFIDTPLDVAMARRLLRDLASESPENTNHALHTVRSDLTAYLDYARDAYLELDVQVKPGCDLILDGCRSVDDIAQEIAAAIKAKG